MQGFKNIVARIGWEMNGNYYAWHFANVNATKWNLAFKHIANVVRNESLGAKVRVTWNPSLINWEGIDAGTTGYLIV